MSITNFIKQSRVRLEVIKEKNEKRSVFVTKIEKESSSGHELSKFVADKAPFFYRDFDSFVKSLEDGFLLTTIKESLEKLPTSDWFQSSHFGEITAGIYVEDILHLKKLYSKLSLNTSENQNPYKMDLVCYKPDSDPLEFVFCEVKSSPKHSTDGMPPNHHQSCYSDLFKSLREYENKDERFDITSIKDQFQITDEEEKTKIKECLKPYSEDKRKISYLGIAIIDESTFSNNEAQLLATRKSNKIFEAELLCLEGYRDVSKDTYKILDQILKSL